MEHVYNIIKGLALSPAIFVLAVCIELIVVTARFYDALSRPVYSIRLFPLFKSLRTLFIFTFIVTSIEILDSGFETLIVPLVILYLLFSVARIVSAVYSLSDIVAISTALDVFLKHQRILDIFSNHRKFILAWHQIRVVRKNAKNLWKTFVFSVDSVYSKALYELEANPDLVNPSKKTILSALYQKLVSDALEQVGLPNVIPKEEIVRGMLDATVINPGRGRLETHHQLVFRELVSWGLFQVLISFVCEYTAIQLQRVYVSVCSEDAAGSVKIDGTDSSGLADDSDSGCHPGYL